MTSEIEGMQTLVRICEVRGWSVVFVPPPNGDITDKKLLDMYSPFDKGHYMVYYRTGGVRMIYADNRGVTQLSNLLQEQLHDAS
jgi:hypothetical protein